MKKPDLSNATKMFAMLKKGIGKNAPVILTSMGVTGMIGAGILAVGATPKALRLIEEEQLLKAEKEPADNEQVKLTPQEIVKVTWKCYIPAVATAIFSTACLVGAQSVNARRNAALATAYKLSETALSEYKGSKDGRHLRIRGLKITEEKTDD